MQEEQDNSSELDIAAQTFAWQKQTAGTSKKYLWGSLFGLILLIIQVNYFLGYSIAQSPEIRPYLISISKLLKQTLPTYKNIADFTIIGSHLATEKNKQHRVKISFINHGNFPQKVPNLLLTLRNLQGGILAQRTFTSKKHQNPDILNSLIAPNELFTIDFPINVPNYTISGYSIELK